MDVTYPDNRREHRTVMVIKTAAKPCLFIAKQMWIILFAYKIGPNSGQCSGPPESRQTNPKKTQFFFAYLEIVASVRSQRCDPFEISRIEFRYWRRRFQQAQALRQVRGGGLSISNNNSNYSG